MMSDQIMDIFLRTGALMEGHFVLTSGLHSGKYFQCAQLLQYPDYTEFAARELLLKLSPLQVDLVISPALGGIVIGYEVARQLGVRSIFAERKEGPLVLRRGFKIEKGEKCLVIEDVVTTGGSTQEVIDVVLANGGEVAAAGVLVDRSGGRANFRYKMASLIQVDVKNWQPDECPLCKQNIPFDKPGSRPIKR
ncbi:orotate phosphoribosyltransferase [bacterium]|nr:orotate phosphoribosyltransferase [bacterium]